MKKSFLISILSICLFGCDSKTKQKSNLDSTVVVAEENSSYKDLYGMWVGDFVPVKDKSELQDAMTNKITLIIKNITTNNDVEGQSIVAGNSRPLKGKLTKLGERLSFVLDEPGNEQFDGRFEFNFDDNKLIGKWNAYKTTVQVTERSFALVKKSFSYNPNLMLSENGDYVDYDGVKKKDITDTIDGVEETYTDEYYRAASDAVYTLNASTTELTEADLKNLRKLDLQILRNTIFARHGYTFKKKTYRQFFNPVEWYVPTSKNIDGRLTAIEKDNIKLLLKFEKYAEDNYDTFGR